MSVQANLARLLAAMATVGITTAGCVSMPQSSSVQPGQAAGAQAERPLSSNTPDGPRPGAGRKEIATGYLNAMLAYPPAPDVLRQFLTSEAAADWNPEDSLIVYTDSSEPRLAEKSDSVAFSALAVGSLDSRGSWKTALPGEQLISRDLKMDRLNGEWRLRNPLPGTYVDRDYFATYFQSLSLYFFDATKSILTPDPVHLLRGDSLATFLVNDLLQGPTDDLGGVVSSGVPSTATVDVSVSVSATGLAEVPLTEEVLGLSADARRLFAAQLAWTLRPLEEINAIVVTVDGNRLDLGAGTEIGVDEFSGFDPAGFATSRQLYALSGQGLVTVSDTDTTTVPGSILVASRRARSAAVAPDASQGAVVDKHGRTVTVGGLAAPTEGISVWFKGARHLLKPSWDVHNLLWVVDNARPGARVYVVTDHSVRRLDAPGISGKNVSAFAVSRDGVRLAALVGSGGDARLLVSVVDRDAKGARPVAVRPAREVVTPDVVPRGLASLAWMSPSSVAALADKGGEPEPFEFNIDGSAVTPFAGFLPIRPTSLAAGPNTETPTVISDDRGGVYVATTDAQWVQIGGSASVWAPFYPG